MFLHTYILGEVQFSDRDCFWLKEHLLNYHFSAGLCGNVAPKFSGHFERSGANFAQNQKSS